MMAFSDLWVALQVRWRIEALVSAIALAVLVIAIFLMPHRYTATASLFFDDLTPEPVNGVETKPGTIIATQANLVKSSAVAAEVAKQIGLTTNPDAINRWRAATGGVGDPATWLGQALLPGLDVASDAGSNVLTINYSSGDPQFAALVANGFASAFVDERLSLRTTPAKTYSKWFELQSESARRKLESAQQSMTDFQREHGIVDDGAFNAETSLLSEYLHQKAGADATSAQARSMAASGAANGMVQDSPVVQGLRAQIASKTAEISQMSTAYGPNHPTMLAARAQLASMQSKLNEARGVAMGALNASTGSSFTQKGDLDRMVAEQRARIIQMSNNRSQFDLLRKDVESARAEYDEVMKQLSQKRLESDLPRANVRQLDQAQPPSSPTFPRIPLAMFLAVVIALMAGVTAGVVLEWLYPRVRTSEGFEQTTGIPVVVRFNFRKSAIRTVLEDLAA